MKRNPALNLAINAADLDRGWMEIDNDAEEIHRILTHGVETDEDVEIVKGALGFLIMNLAQKRAERDIMNAELAASIDA